MKKSLILVTIITLMILSGCKNTTNEVSPENDNNSGAGRSVSLTIGGGENNTDQAKVLDYSTETLNEAKKNGIPILYFYADWCPTCRVFLSELEESIEKVPSEVYILKIDFDEAKELKKKWGIVIQHTLIQLDENGDEVTRWVGGGIELLNQELVLN